jgi:hypothetical protein
MSDVATPVSEHKCGDQHQEGLSSLLAMLPVEGCPTPLVESDFALDEEFRQGAAASLVEGVFRWRVWATLCESSVELAPDDQTRAQLRVLQPRCRDLAELYLAPLTQLGPATPAPDESHVGVAAWTDVVTHCCLSGAVTLARSWQDAMSSYGPMHRAGTEALRCSSEIVARGLRWLGDLSSHGGLLNEAQDQLAQRWPRAVAEIEQCTGEATLQRRGLGLQRSGDADAHGMVQQLAERLEARSR